MNDKPISGIEFQSPDEVRHVSKPWGWEKWIADGRPNFDYAFKMIHVRAPHKTSLQVHKDKQESMYFIEGSGVLHYVEEPVDTGRLERGELSKEELAEIIGRVKTRAFKKGDVIHVRPGWIHRLEAVDEDITLMETSTVHLDDVLRLQDDAHRPHGRIEREHQG